MRQKQTRQEKIKKRIFKELKKYSALKDINISEIARRLKINRITVTKYFNEYKESSLKQEVVDIHVEANNKVAEVVANSKLPIEKVDNVLDNIQEDVVIDTVISGFLRQSIKLQKLQDTFINEVSSILSSNESSDKELKKLNRIIKDMAKNSSDIARELVKKPQNNLQVIPPPVFNLNFPDDNDD